MHPPKHPEYSYPRSGEKFSDTAETGEKLTFASHGRSYSTERMRSSIGLYANLETIDIIHDAYTTNDQQGIYAVADGGGQKVDNNVASLTATNAFAEAVGQQRSHLLGTRNEERIRSILHSALAQTDQAVAREVKNTGADIKSGTTLTSAVYLGDNRFAFVNIGNSAAFVVDPNGEINRITSEQARGTKLRNSIRGTGRSKRSLLKRQALDEITIREVEPGSHIILLTDGLIGVTPEQRIDPQLYANEIMESNGSEGAVNRLMHLPRDVYRDERAVIREGVAQPRIDDATAVVIKVSGNDQFVSPTADPEASPESTSSQRKRQSKFGKKILQVISRPFGKFGEYKSARKNKRTPDSAANVPRGSESTQNRLSRRERLRHFGRGILDHAYNARTFAGRQLDRFDTAVGSSWAQFTAYKAARQPRNFEYKTPSKRKLAAIGGIALAAAGTFAAVKYGFDIPDFNMPDVSVPFGDIVDGAVEDIEDALSGDNSVEGFAVPETTPPSITLQDMVSTPMNSWNGTSGNTGFLSGTVYDQVAQSVTELAHNNKIDFDISQLRQQNPGTFEHDYYTFIDNVLQSNNITWEQAAQLPAGSTLDIDSDHVQTFLTSQNIKLPPVESPPVSAPQETNVHPGVIASVAAVGVATMLGGWLAARRRKKRQNSAPA